jgi:hypothetical protein
MRQIQFSDASFPVSDKSPLSIRVDQDKGDICFDILIQNVVVIGDVSGIQMLKKRMTHQIIAQDAYQLRIGLKMAQNERFVQGITAGIHSDRIHFLFSGKKRLPIHGRNKDIHAGGTDDVDLAHRIIIKEKPTLQLVYLDLLSFLAFSLFNLFLTPGLT